MKAEWLEGARAAAASFGLRVPRSFVNRMRVGDIDDPLLRQILPIGAELDRRRFSNVKIWTRGVDHALFRPYPRDHLDLPRPIILYDGRLAVEKGIDDFIALKVKGTKVLVGDGPERERLENRELTGRQRQIADRHAASDDRGS